MTTSGEAASRPRGGAMWTAFAGTVLCALGAVATWVIGSMQADAWNTHALDVACRDLPPLPPFRLYGIVGLVLDGVTILAAAAWVALFFRERPSRIGFVVGALCVLAVVIFVNLLGTASMFVPTDDPSATSQGTDGSGLPCGSG
ncbi:hypothetical protein [Gordonia soli]|nr:hypothetical protein [Gordonia soli]